MRLVLLQQYDVFGCIISTVKLIENNNCRSPNYPAKYDGPGKGLASRACNWYLSARNGYKILMHFEFFHVEGDPESIMLQCFHF